MEPKQEDLNRWIAKRWKKYQPYLQDDIDFSEDEINKANAEITKQILSRNEYLNWKNNKK